MEVAASEVAYPTHVSARFLDSTRLDGLTVVFWTHRIGSEHAHARGTAEVKAVGKEGRRASERIQHTATHAEGDRLRQAESAYGQLNVERDTRSQG